METLTKNISISKNQISDILKKNHETIVNYPNFEGSQYGSEEFNIEISGEHFNMNISGSVEINFDSHEEFTFGDVSANKIHIINDECEEFEISENLLEGVLNCIEFVH